MASIDFGMTRASVQQSMPKSKKKLPDFKNEDEERKFWATADSTEYLDWPSGKRKKFVQLKPTLSSTSLYVPEQGADLA